MKEGSEASAATGNQTKATWLEPPVLSLAGQTGARVWPARQYSAIELTHQATTSYHSPLCTGGAECSSCTHQSIFCTSSIHSTHYWTFPTETRWHITERVLGSHKRCHTSCTPCVQARWLHYVLVVYQLIGYTGHEYILVHAVYRVITNNELYPVNDMGVS